MTQVTGARDVERPVASGAQEGMAPADVVGEVPVGERIRRLRLERGMSQSELAAGRLSKGFISQIESGRSRPSPESLRFIAQRLSVPLVALLPGLELAQQQAFLLRAAEAAVKANELAEAETLLDEAHPLLSAPLERAWFHRLRGQMLMQRNQLDEALDEGLTAFDELSGGEVTDETVRACNLIGNVHQRAGRQPAALLYFDRAAALASQQGVSPAMRALVNSNRGNAHLILGDPAHALQAYETARAAAEDAEDIWQLAIAHFGLGEAARQRGDLPSAIAHSERAITLFERIEMRQLQAQILHNLGHIYGDKGDLATARSFQDQALAAAHGLKNTRMVGYALERLAALEVAEGNAEGGLAQARAAIEAARASGDNSLLANAYAALAEAHELAGDRQAADEAFVDARRIAETAFVMDRRQVLLRQGAVLRRRQDFEGASACFEEAAHLSAA